MRCNFCLLIGLVTVITGNQRWMADIFSSQQPLGWPATILISRPNVEMTKGGELVLKKKIVGSKVQGNQLIISYWQIIRSWCHKISIQPQRHKIGFMKVGLVKEYVRCVKSKLCCVGVSIRLKSMTAPNSISPSWHYTWISWLLPPGSWLRLFQIGRCRWCRELRPPALIKLLVTPTRQETSKPRHHLPFTASPATPTLLQHPAKLRLPQTTTNKHTQNNGRTFAVTSGPNFYRHIKWLNSPPEHNCCHHWHCSILHRFPEVQRC